MRGIHTQSWGSMRGCLPQKLRVGKEYEGPTQKFRVGKICEFPSPNELRVRYKHGVQKFRVGKKYEEAPLI